MNISDTPTKKYYYYKPIEHKLRYRKNRTYDNYGILDIDTYRKDLRNFVDKKYDISYLNEDNCMNIARSCIKEMGKNMCQIMDCFVNDDTQYELNIDRTFYKNDRNILKKTI